MPASPAPRTLSTATELGRELKHWLRVAPSRPSVQALARAVDVSPSTIYAYLSGTTLPPETVLDAILLYLQVPTDDHRRLVTKREHLAQGRRRRDAQPPSRPRPCELPTAPALFAGRALERLRLSALFDQNGTAGPHVVAITGTAGVGKTALAVVAATSANHDFPDGIIWLDLQGFSRVSPTAPTDAMIQVLRRLGDPLEVRDEDFLRHRFLERVSPRRLLLVLDNALDEEQVRPLIPGSGPARVIVTSRTDLAGLAVDPGAELLPLEPLDPEDAVRLLEDGPDEAARHALAERCGHLPLVLRLAAARSRTDSLSAAELLALLDHESALDTLDVGDIATAPRLIFAASESRLSTAERNAFQFLGVIPIARFHTHQAAALWAVDDASAARRLRWLQRTGLVHAERGQDEWQMHDLLHEFAVERAQRSIRLDDRRAAFGRFVQTMIDDRGDGIAWSTVETLFETAVTIDHDQAIYDLAAVASGRRNHYGRRQGMLPLFTAARDIAVVRGDLAGQARFEALRAGVLAMGGQYAEAIPAMHRALAIVRTVDEPNIEAGILNDLGNVHLEMGDYVAAADSYRTALAPARRSGLTIGQATLQQNIGWAMMQQDDPVGAEDHYHEALQLFQSIDDGPGTARSLLGIGGSRLLQGRLPDAFELLSRSTATAQENQARVIEAYAIAWTGKALAASGDQDAAQTHLDEALAMATETGEQPLHAFIFEEMAHIAAAQGDSLHARELLSAALDHLPCSQHPSAARLRDELSRLNTAWSEAG